MSKKTKLAIWFYSILAFDIAIGAWLFITLHNHPEIVWAAGFFVKGLLR